MTNTTGRINIPIATQVQVFFRDGWMCHYCAQPTVFAPALKYLAQFIKDAGYPYPTAYYDLRYRRDKSPLLDHLAAVIDHIEPHSKGGSNDAINFVTACNKCNSRKSNRSAQDHRERNPAHAIEGQYGEPKDWDGFASFFVVYCQKHPERLTAQEKSWLQETQDYLRLK